MEIKCLKLPTNDSKIYHQILAFLNPLFNLTTQERSILAELIRLDIEYETLPPEKRAKFIFSREMREEMCEKLNIKKNHFGVVLSNLKQKKFLDGKLLIDEYNAIHPFFKIKPDQEGFRLSIDFAIVQNPVAVSYPLPDSQQVSEQQEEVVQISQNREEEEIKETKMEDYIEPEIEFTLTPPNE